MPLNVSHARQVDNHFDDENGGVQYADDAAQRGPENHRSEDNAEESGGTRNGDGAVQCNGRTSRNCHPPAWFTHYV